MTHDFVSDRIEASTVYTPTANIETEYLTIRLLYSLCPSISLDLFHLPETGPTSTFTHHDHIKMSGSGKSKDKVSCGSGSH